MHAQTERLAAVNHFQRNGVVDVLGVLAVYRDKRHVPQVPPRPYFLLRHGLRHGVRLGSRLFRESRIQLSFNNNFVNVFLIF